MLTFNEFVSKDSLKNQLFQLRSFIADAAQKVYDEWEPEEDDSGGICDQIETAISGVICDHIEGIETQLGGHDGDDHAWTVVYNDNEAYGVDISPYVYEMGAGYSWQKRPNVRIWPQYVQIFEIDRQSI